VIVLDTHVWLWWMSEPERLSQPARDAITEAASVGVSTMSAWEITMLATRKRIVLDRDVGAWIRQALAQPRLEALAPTAEIAVAAGLLDARSFPGDPIDRLIYATAVATGARLITRDEAIRQFDPDCALW
jgi:PIN domain nuclease of toxin-antitoxin system